MDETALQKTRNAARNIEEDRIRYSWCAASQPINLDMAGADFVSSPRCAKCAAFLAIMLR